MGGHAMPFGAAVVPDGVRFRLWAPAARAVDVRLETLAAPALLPMHEAGDGWFELVTDAAGPGTRYAFRIDGGTVVPDPASRFQPEDVHGPSMVVDADAYRWTAPDWRGRPWHEAVLYELHVGAFTAEGTFDGAAGRLDHLADLGVTAIELMPIADFSGNRNWGYDGVLPYAPDSVYGTPDTLKRLVDGAHARGLMVLLDVVYNHFGPDGNFLHVYAPQFFTERHDTPWGAAIDFARREVRDYFIHNALYWLEEYRFDGLRLDAVHAIVDDGEPHVLQELAQRVDRQFGADRHVHLVLENEHNAAHWLERRGDGRPRFYTAQWNDDIHHAFHVLATGERVAYYRDYADRPLAHLARCLAEGFAFQGEALAHRGGTPRGEPSAHLPPTAFVTLVQNHDQIGNRAFGERLTALAEPEAVAALTALLLLNPMVPLLFMGEEWGETRPFLFFCDFHGALAEAVRTGRRREFAAWPQFSDEALRETIPDPNDRGTFVRSTLDWTGTDSPEGSVRLGLVRALIAIRTAEIVPRLAGMTAMNGTAEARGERGIEARWSLGDGSRLACLANLGGAPFAATLPGRGIFSLGAVAEDRWAAHVTLEDGPS